MPYMKDETHPHLLHNQPFVLTTCNSGPHLNTSNFAITLQNVPKFNGLHTMFGVVVEGQEVLQRINEVGVGVFWDWCLYSYMVVIIKFSIFLSIT